jgi:hypothetical protein
MPWSPPHSITLCSSKIKPSASWTHASRGATPCLDTHCWPGTLYLLSWSDFIRRDAEGSILLDSRTLPRPAHGSAFWSAAMPPHTLENIGASDLHLISVELKSR